MTISQRILAHHAGRQEVEPGEIVSVKVDLVMVHDGTGPGAIAQFRKIGKPKVFDPDKIALVLDHRIPAKDITSAENAKILREFAREQGLTRYYESGRSGICHCLLPEQGLVVPGDLVVGADSHTTTYGGLGAFSTGVGYSDVAYAMALGEIWLKVPRTIKIMYQGTLPHWLSGKDLILFTLSQLGSSGALYRSLEFAGSVIGQSPMEGRFTICNMAVEAGAKNGIIAPDEITLKYVEGRATRGYTFVHSDEDAAYEEICEYDVSELRPQIACPHSPANVKPVDEIAVEIDQVFLGSCTNSRLGDLQIGAEILRGRKVHPYVRLIVIPGTPAIYLEALRQGLLEVFVEAGAAVSTPTCGACAGLHMGVLAEGERCVSTSNRNFVGRMGHTSSEVYLASPAVAAASAIMGRIASPEEVY